VRVIGWSPFRIAGRWWREKKSSRAERGRSFPIAETNAEPILTVAYQLCLPAGVCTNVYGVVMKRQDERAALTAGLREPPLRAHPVPLPDSPPLQTR
jgi:hypothetical protein